MGNLAGWKTTRIFCFVLHSVTWFSPPPPTLSLSFIHSLSNPSSPTLTPLPLPSFPYQHPSLPHSRTPLLLTSPSHSITPDLSLSLPPFFTPLLPALLCYLPSTQFLLFSSLSLYTAHTYTQEKDSKVISYIFVLHKKGRKSSLFRKLLWEARKGEIIYEKRGESVSVSRVNSWVEEYKCARVIYC